MTTVVEAALASAAREGAVTTVALMTLLMAAASEQEARVGLARAIATQTDQDDRLAAGRLMALDRLWQAHPDAWTQVHAVADRIVHRRAGDSPEAALRYWAATFDTLAATAPEASVALYSLGSVTLLQAMTDEIVVRMDEWSLLRRDGDVLEIGCGIGRFLVALAPLVRSVVGLDISARMVAEARARCRHLGNVEVRRSEGRDLRDVPDGSLTLVLAADVFPYLVEAGGDLAAAHVAESARVLRPGGALLILNYAYSSDGAGDRRTVADLARGAGLVLERDGTRDFALWDGIAFLLRKPRASAEPRHRAAVTAGREP